MSFSDDELPPAISSAGPKPVQAGRVRLVAYNNEEAPLEQHRQQVLLEVTDTSFPVERSWLDLVIVFDVSGSMGDGEKLDKLKTAMKLVISKLGPMDRLSVVSFAEKRCPLLCMTRASKEKLMKDIVENGVRAGGGGNIEDGLKIGLNVLAGRRHTDGRVSSVILMSDGKQGPAGDARAVDIGDVAVYTFGFGGDNDAKAHILLRTIIIVLEAIASKSQGGTYYFVRDGESLCEHLSQVLAGLLSVVVRDLRLTVWEQLGHSKTDKVDAGGYTQVAEYNGSGGLVTIFFGDLYSGEVRKVIVDLVLPAVGREDGPTPVLFAQCLYSIQGKGFYSPPEHLECIMRRTGTASWPPDAMMPEPVKGELVRRRHASKLKEASELTDLNSARLKLQEAKQLDLVEQYSPTTNILTTELMMLLSLATWPELLACLLASWTSHYRQRFAGRGDVRGVRIFDTPRMGRYLVQATELEKNPNMSVPSVDDDDVKEKIDGARAASYQPPRRRIIPPRHRYWSSGWASRAGIILCTLLAIALIAAGAAVLAVYLLYKPKTPYLVVADAQLVQLQYDGTIRYLQVSITILAENNNSKAEASFSHVDLALGFQGADVALLRAEPFVVAPRSALPLQYNVVSAGRTLGTTGMRGHGGRAPGRRGAARLTRQGAHALEGGCLPQHQVLDAYLLPPPLLLPRKRHRRAQRSPKMPLQVALARTRSATLASIVYSLIYSLLYE
ncbi:hypothetical protein EJB05_34370, partial [Eragrostis curvula]